MERVHADTCVVINAFKGAEDVVRKRCQGLLGNPDIEVLFSDGGVDMLHRAATLGNNLNLPTADEALTAATGFLPLGGSI